MSRVTSTNYPFLPVIFRIGETEQSGLAFVDTGFDGYLIIPEGFEDELGQGDYLSKWELADGSVSVGPEYLGNVQIKGLGKDKIPARITCIGDEFILGQDIIRKYRFIFDHGEKLEVSN